MPDLSSFVIAVATYFASWDARAARMQLCATCGRAYDDGTDHCPEDEYALVQALEGTRVFGNRYALDQRIAAGSMGVVFRARHIEIGSPVAVKLMRTQQEGARATMARFRREAQILGRIKHPNAVLVMDFGVEERGDRTIPFIVTEFLRGRSLEHAMGDATYSLSDAEQIITPLCEAVAEAHDLGIVHRDIKPANIFIEELRDKSEVVKVLDFGLAQLLDPVTSSEHEPDGDGDTILDFATIPSTLDGDTLVDGTSSERGVVGTPNYMAPEQARGEEITAATDVYAIATVFFRLVTGRLPFEGEAAAVMLQKALGRAPPLVSLPSETPDHLEACIRRSLGNDPGLRPTALELAETLQWAVRSAAAHTESNLTAKLESAALLLKGLIREVEAFDSDAADEATYNRLRDALARVDGPLAGLAQNLATNDPSTDSRARDAVDSFRSEAQKLDRKLRRLFTGSQVEAYREYLAALTIRTSTTIRSLRRRLSRADTGEVPADPFGADYDKELIDELARMLSGGDLLDADDALDLVLYDAADEFDAFLTAHATRSSELAERVVAGLVFHADHLLLMQLFPGPGSKRLLQKLVQLTAVQAAEPIRVLASLYRKNRLPLAKRDINDAVGRFAPDVQRVLLKSLLVHHAPDIRRHALGQLSPPDLWTVIAYPRAPISVLNRVFLHVQADVPKEYLKVFFLCTQSNLRSASSPREVQAAYGLLVDFFRVGCFHEDVIFEPLVELERHVKVRAFELGLEEALSQLEAAHVGAFIQEGASPDVLPESMGGVPLPIQRKIARDGYFLPYFVSHPKEKVARETIPHLLRLEEVTNYLKIRSIHRAVITELAKHRRFFFREESRLLLLHNPKTSGRAASRYIPVLNQAQLTHLARDKNANPEVRNLAKRASAKRGRST